MAVEHTILFTVVPRAIAVDSDTLPVSVFVAPRLRGADRLDAFTDWVTWTRRLKEDGLILTIRCGNETADVPIDQAPLNPEFWEALFKPETFVQSHGFDDYSDRGVLSYSVRDALSALKSVYQQAAVDLALPDRPDGGPHRVEGGNRRALRGLLEGFDVHWNPDAADGLRRAVRVRGRPVFAARTEELDAEGLLVAPADPNARRAATLPFAAFHHMPLPPYGEDGLRSPDWKTELDFHKALASLNAYPTLQRALGIVLDFELPRDFVPVSTTVAVETLSVAGAAPGSGWALAPGIPELETGCLHLRLPDSRRLFLAAPRALVDGSAPTEAIGLLHLDEHRFGLAQVDVDGAMHKVIMLAETWHNPDPQRNLDQFVQPERAPHPEVFDPGATLPSLRSGGLSLYADRRAQQLLDTLRQSKGFNAALESGSDQPRPLCAEDLLRGYRLDVWDSHTGNWHSLHLRKEEYRAGHATEQPPGPEEGFVQLALTQPAPGAEPPTDDLYLHEAIARWGGWSLSVPFPGRAMSRYADPDKALPEDDDDPDFAVNEPVTPFKLETTFDVVKESLPRLRFGTRYRLRARVVDLAGNSLRLDDTVADQLAEQMALPHDTNGLVYLRYEPVSAPLVVLRDADGVTGPGSAIDRLVIRTFNGGAEADATAADLNAAERHILPPRTSVELGERLGMFDDANGKLKSDAATWQLIADRDAGELAHVKLVVAGKEADYPLEQGEDVEPLPYLPDPLARGAALRDLPGTSAQTVGEAAGGPLSYEALDDPSPRPGSATIIEFPGADVWEDTRGFRLALAEPPGVDEAEPTWDADALLLTAYLPKGTMTTVPLTSFVRVADLPLLGQWQWLREYVEGRAAGAPEVERLSPGGDVDEIAHVLQRAVEGGHWLLTPPRLLTLVHAVQQPLGRPEFSALDVQHDPERAAWDPDPLQTEPITGRADPTELAVITAWRRLGATDSYLLGGLRVHAASTAKIDLEAAWVDPVDTEPEGPSALAQKAHVDELPLPTVTEGYLIASGAERRRVGYYDLEHDQIAFARAGDWIGRPGWNELSFENAAPRHLLNDTKHHRVTYTATATTRYREYFAADEGPFTRSSESIEVDVPASARPLAPTVAYVLPTFGWQRQVDTNLMRSVRFGGGLRVYLERPWFSSGAGELLGVSLWSSANGAFDREKFKPFITQWGMDPLWRTAGLSGVPAVRDFPDAVGVDYQVSLEEPSAHVGHEPGRVDVVGFKPEYDKSRGLWFADLTVNTPSPTYMPFVRLAVVRYQPHALADAKVSRVVLADFAQLTPDRTATVTFDPYRPRHLRVAVSGVAPRGPSPGGHQRATTIHVRVQQRRPDIATDLGWEDAPPQDAAVTVLGSGPAPSQPDLALWAGAVDFAEDPEPGRYRLLIEELEPVRVSEAAPKRLVYAEAFELR